MGENPAISEAHAVQPVTPAIRFLQKQVPARFVAVAPYIGVNPLPPDVNMRYGLYDARGYDLPVISSFGQVWTRYVAPPTPLLPLDTPAVPVLDLEFHPGALRILSLMGVTDILEQKAEKPLQLPGVHVAYDGPDATVYSNDNALPRTWLVSDQLVEPSASQALTALGSADLPARARSPSPQRPCRGWPRRRADGRRPVSRHRGRPASPTTGPNRSPSTPGPPGPRNSSCPTPTTRAGRCTVNGRPTRLDRVDYMFRGVPVPAGSDRIVFTYDPSSFRIGWMISLVAVVVLVVVVAFGLTRRRRSVPRHGRSPASSVPA